MNSPNAVSQDKNSPPVNSRAKVVVVLAVLWAANGWSLAPRGLSHFQGNIFSAHPDLPVPQRQSDTGSKGRTKVAEGEYAILEEENSGAVGPFEEMVYHFHETWTLWRTPGRQYEVTGEREFESPKDSPVNYRFETLLSRDLTVLRITAFTHLRWRRDSGPLTCDFRSNDLHCSSGARDPRQALELNIPSDRPFGLLWPISVFSISGIARQAERDSEHPTPIKLISITQPSQEQPIDPVILDGELRYLGEEEMQAAGIRWQAHKFSFRVPSHPEFLLWTSPRGLLLALTVAHAHPNWAKEGLRLVHFQQAEAF